MLARICAACFKPIIGIVVGGGIVNAGKMEGLAPLDARAAAAAMPHATLVAGPRFGKRHAKPRTFADDVSFRHRRPVRQCRASEPAANVADVDDIVGYPKPRRAAARIFEFLLVASTVIKRNKMGMNARIFARLASDALPTFRLFPTGFSIISYISDIAFVGSSAHNGSGTRL